MFQSEFFSTIASILSAGGILATIFGQPEISTVLSGVGTWFSTLSFVTDYTNSEGLNNIYKLRSDSIDESGVGVYHGYNITKQSYLDNSHGETFATISSTPVEVAFARASLVNVSYTKFSQVEWLSSTIPADFTEVSQGGFPVYEMLFHISPTMRDADGVSLVAGTDYNVITLDDIPLFYFDGASWVDRLSILDDFYVG